MWLSKIVDFTKSSGYMKYAEDVKLVLLNTLWVGPYFTHCSIMVNSLFAISFSD